MESIRWPALPHLRFTGEFLVPGQSWHAQMELEHWERYRFAATFAQGLRVADVASGEGYGSALLAEKARHVTGIDVGVAQVDHANRTYAAHVTNLSYRQADASKGLPVEAPVDLITSFETLEHLQDQAALIAQFAKALGDEGLLLMSTPVPNLDPATGKPYNAHHVRELNQTELETLLAPHFRYSRLFGQAGQLPFELHEGVHPSDRYLIVVASNVQARVDAVLATLPSWSFVARRQELFERATKATVNATVHKRPRPLRAVFVPLVPGVFNDNPANRRRTVLLAEGVRSLGYEVACMEAPDVEPVYADLVISQDRNFDYWRQIVPGLKRRGAKFVFSLSDAFFLGDESLAHYGEQARRASPMDAAFRQFLALCDFVLVGSTPQADALAALGVARDRMLVDLDPVDASLYQACDRRPWHPGHGPFTAVWEGYCDNVPYLGVVAKPLAQLAKELPFELVVLSASQRRNTSWGTTDNRALTANILGDVPHRFLEWSPAAVREAFAQAHVGLAPLLNDRFAAAKPANKQAIYAWAGLPTISTETRASRDWHQRYGVGRCVRSPSEWLVALRQLATDENAHREATANCARAAQTVTPLACAERLAEVMERLVGPGRR